MPRSSGTVSKPDKKLPVLIAAKPISTPGTVVPGCSVLATDVPSPTPDGDNVDLDDFEESAVIENVDFTPFAEKSSSHSGYRIRLFHRYKRPNRTVFDTEALTGYLLPVFSNRYCLPGDAG